MPKFTEQKAKLLVVSERNFIVSFKAAMLRHGILYSNFIFSNNFILQDNINKREELNLYPRKFVDSS